MCIRDSSQHLDQLKDAGLVSTRREGRYIFLHLDTTPLRDITNRWTTPRYDHPKEQQ